MDQETQIDQHPADRKCSLCNQKLRRADFRPDIAWSCPCGATTVRLRGKRVTVQPGRPGPKPAA